MLGGDELVAEGLRFLLRLLQNAPEPRRGGELHVSAHLRLPLELGRERRGKLRRLDAECRQHARDDASGLVHERGGQVLDIELGVAFVARLLLRGNERLLRLLGQFVRVNHSITFQSGTVRSARADGS